MVSDHQIRRLKKYMKTERYKSGAAAKAGMDEKTARKYCRLGKLPSEVKVEHTWRTRQDPFEDVWDEVVEKLSLNPGFEAQSLFDYLKRQYPGKFLDGQLRTLQRRIKRWRALEGPGKEVFFPQNHHPGHLCQSDFTHMKHLGIRICGRPFDHLLYHFVLTYSNWESGMICFSESFESLSEGLQNALWQLGGIPKEHQTDSLSAAVRKNCSAYEFTDRYSALMRYYDLSARKSNVNSPHENGDVEQRHYRFKKSIEQALLLRDSRDFNSREEYNDFLQKHLKQLNACREDRLLEELKLLKKLPARRLESCKHSRVRVTQSSTIRVNHKVYSLHSRLIGEWVQVRLYMEYLEVWYAQRKIEKLPRLIGSDSYYIQYRHIIDWLVRKPGAFENYRYREALFPTHRFRMAYDELKKTHPTRSAAQYLEILYLAAYESEVKVDNALKILLEQQRPIHPQSIKALLKSGGADSRDLKDVEVAPVKLEAYDVLLSERTVNL